MYTTTARISPFLGLLHLSLKYFDTEKLICQKLHPTHACFHQVQFFTQEFPSSPKKFRNRLKQVLFNTRARNSNLAKSLGEKRNHTVYQDENPHRGLLSLQN